MSTHDADAYGFPRQLTPEQQRVVRVCDARAELLAHKEWEPDLARAAAKGPLQRRLGNTNLKKSCRRGVPPALRPIVWLRVSGADALRRALGAQHYHDCLAALAHDATHPAVKQVDLDVARTFPEHPRFRSAAGQAALRDVLLAHAAHNPAVGYCQGLNFVAAALLVALRDDAQATFWLLCALIEGKLLEGTYDDTISGCQVEVCALEGLLQRRLPRLARHLRACDVPLLALAPQWYLTLFTQTLPMATALRVLDALCFEGSKVLHRVALALFQLAAPALLAARDTVEASAALTRVATGLVDRDFLLRVATTGVGRLRRRDIDRLRDAARARVPRAPQRTVPQAPVRAKAERIAGSTPEDTRVPTPLVICGGSSRITPAPAPAPTTANAGQRSTSADAVAPSRVLSAHLRGPDVSQADNGRPGRSEAAALQHVVQRDAVLPVGRRAFESERPAALAASEHRAQAGPHRTPRTDGSRAHATDAEHSDSPVLTPRGVADADHAAAGTSVAVAGPPAARTAHGAAAGAAHARHGRTASQDGCGSRDVGARDVDVYDSSSMMDRHWWLLHGTGSRMDDDADAAAAACAASEAPAAAQRARRGGPASSEVPADVAATSQGAESCRERAVTTAVDPQERGVASHRVHDLRSGQIAAERYSTSRRGDSAVEASSSSSAVSGISTVHPAEHDSRRSRGSRAQRQRKATRQRLLAEALTTGTWSHHASAMEPAASTMGGTASVMHAAPRSGHEASAARHGADESLFQPPAAALWTGDESFVEVDSRMEAALPSQSRERTRRQQARRAAWQQHAERG